MEYEQILNFGLIAVIVLLILVMFFMYFDIKLKTDLGFDRIIGSKGLIPFEMFEGGAPLDQGIGPYSNIKLKHSNGDNFMRNPKLEELQSGNMYVPSGTPLPLEPTLSGPLWGSTGTTVDGTDQTPESMFMFKYNQCKPECCPGTYSCSGGCVCRNKKQRDFIANRGNNRHFDEGY